MEYLKDEVLPFSAMVIIEICEVGMVTLGKAAISSGMNNAVFVVYYNAIGTIFLFFYYLFSIHRSRTLPSFNFLCKFFLLGLLGTFLVPITAFIGVKYGSATLALAMGNLIPGLTFLLAVILRMEKLSVNSRGSQAKVTGTVISIAGAFIITLYKGPPILKFPSSHDSSRELLLSQDSNWVIGGLILTITCISSATTNIFQTAILKEYPEKMTVVFFSCLFGTIQCAIFTIITQRNPSAWTLHHDIEVIATIYAGIFVNVFRGSIVAWCLQKNGPVYVALFKPLSTAIAVIIAFIFLGETPHLGSLIGAITITLGFYAVMWGKAREKDVIAKNISLDPSSTNKYTPLIQNI